MPQKTPPHVRSFYVLQGPDHLNGTAKVPAVAHGAFKVFELVAFVQFYSQFQFGHGFQVNLGVAQRFGLGKAGIQ